MEPVIEHFGGEGEPMLFAHANGYPPGSYAHLFRDLGRHFEISAIEHRPLWGGREPPPNVKWSLFVDDWLRAMDKHVKEPVTLMGHSMGGTISALAAAREPDRFKRLILLDPVFLPTRFRWAQRFMSSKSKGRSPMVRKALGRPEHFSSLEEAFSFYRGKRAFSAMSDDALMNYVKASKEPTGSGVQLRFSPAWEAAVYSANIIAVKPVLQKIKLPTLGLRGKESNTLLPDVFARWHHWQPTAELHELAGGHLFPMEHPHETARAITDYFFPS